MSESIYDNFKDWLNQINQSSLPLQNVIAYNFGIFESENGYIVYLTGSSEYNPEDNDWACNEDYVPTEKYFNLLESLTIEKDWRNVQGEVVSLVKQFLESQESSDSFLAKASAITVGFDDGDLERVM